jgi:polyketide cyclase/dehydrase/lipid transport protein
MPRENDDAWAEIRSAHAGFDACAPTNGNLHTLMLGRITISRMFPTTASASAVWAALEAAPRWPEVLTDLVEARIEPDGVLTEGAIIRTVAKPGTRAIDMAYRVVAADPRLQLAIEATGGGFRARTEYLIEPFAAGARVTLTSQVEPLWWLHRITTELARGSYTKQVEAMMEARTRPMLALAERIQRA